MQIYAISEGWVKTLEECWLMNDQLLFRELLIEARHSKLSRVCMDIIKLEKKIQKSFDEISKHPLIKDKRDD